MKAYRICMGILLSLAAIASIAEAFAEPETHHHKFVLEETTVKRLCGTYNIITVNGQFPGPTLEVRNGDSLIIEVINNGRYNATIHWHGVRQIANPWADGPEMVTQCPIRPGASYTYRFTIEKQEGTLWWHAHSRWLRATVYGALVILPKLGEWWNRDPMSVLQQAIFTGAPPNVSDAYTINAEPGDLYPCSSQGTAKFLVKSGETVLLRVINAALNQQLFFSLADHQLTVVGADSAYTKPFTTSILMLGPGQTTDVLFTANQAPGRYYMAASAYATAQNAAFDNTTTTAILEYKSLPKGVNSRPVLPRLPRNNDTATTTAFTSQFRSPKPVPVPTEIDENLFFAVGLGLVNCAPGPRCQGPNNTRFAASMNNVSFMLPNRTSLMQAYYQKIPGVYTTDFPVVPPVKFDYTGNVPRGLWQPTFGTKLHQMKFGSRVQIVIQDTAIVSTEDHPVHIHGYQFYIVGQGFGNFNPGYSSSFNLIDPPQRNTVDIPVGGWAVIRFKADNPGVWFMHCHIDAHLVWGFATAFIVENGYGEWESVIPPPADLPPC